MSSLAKRPKKKRNERKRAAKTPTRPKPPKPVQVNSVTREQYIASFKFTKAERALIRKIIAEN